MSETLYLPLSQAVPQARAHFATVAPRFAAAIAEVPDPAWPGEPDVYLALLQSISSQQLSVKAADTIFGRFRALFPDAYPTPALLVAMDVETLRGAGVSRQKAGYLQAVAAYAQAQGLDRARLQTLSDAEVIADLTQIRGVGRWTVEMLLMFALDRPDVMSVGDLGLQQAMAAIYGWPDAGSTRELHARMLEQSAAWSPWRSVGCRFLWAWKGWQAHQG